MATTTALAAAAAAVAVGLLVAALYTVSNVSSWIFHIYGPTSGAPASDFTPLPFRNFVDRSAMGKLSPLSYRLRFVSVGKPRASRDTTALDSFGIVNFITLWSKNGSQIGSQHGGTGPLHWHITCYPLLSCSYTTWCSYDAYYYQQHT